MKSSDGLQPKSVSLAMSCLLLQQVLHTLLVVPIASTEDSRLKHDNDSIVGEFGEQ